MREILFRAKRIDNGEWVEGYYGIKGKGTDIENHYIMVPTFQSGIGNYDYMFYFTDVHIDSETLCQFTGLKDKNGNRIWENDILHVVEKMGNDVYHNGNLVSSPRWINEFNFKVEFTPGGLMNTKRFANAPQIECEVIGNIFDKPELLKGDIE